MSEFSKLTRGDPSASPLIFLHGFLGRKEDWKGFFPFFEEQYHCIAWDLPGHGKTPYCESIQDALENEIVKCCHEKPIVIGYSMGGRLALSLKERAQALVLISAHPGLGAEEEKEHRLHSDYLWSQKLLTLPLEEFLKEWYAQPIFHTLPKDFATLRLQQDAKALSLVLLQMSLGKQALCDEFPCPALFLYGEQDKKYQELYHRTLPRGAAVHPVVGCSHAAHLENTSECARVIREWLAQDHR
jgi:2-succinyl-6-hydroxy-2,4-cyclohexadiene-1-carboxylate synthase